jgi:hypothetical protein
MIDFAHAVTSCINPSMVVLAYTSRVCQDCSTKIKGCVHFSGVRLAFLNRVQAWYAGNLLNCPVLVSWSIASHDELVHVRPTLCVKHKVKAPKDWLETHGN